MINSNAYLNDGNIRKKKVAEYAVDMYVHSNMVVGLGSGSTAIWAVRYIATKCKDGILTNMSFGTTGPGTTLEALSCGVEVSDLNALHMREFDVVIDGADEFDEDSNLVKGGGGCLLQEKIVSYSSNEFVVIVSEEKKVKDLGKSFPLPIEIISSAYSRVVHKIKNTYNIDSISLRQDARNIGPWITEEGNYIIDVTFAQTYNPKTVEIELSQIVGVVESGFFTQKKPILLVVDKDTQIRVQK